ncbi:amino acid adenylation domain-containing protein [Streptomyces anulatus]|uniref:amino acid adenylation domain-containing protein n=1 Tax=Streptomyces anulatus TaxID=1892 RepID=UPI002254E475|nr:amino acid adenylation domain-containing protein [Streptomyces anulatus]MCX4521961.1 amino acid adenylation domain-containing protein [Streptomyces anulatus]MCX4604837.1 amino acid adenylation domain-containing protein [Streptomyces anulatus]WTE29660.1 amino acid adenylation domain-containing protein [Streptomyces anulatus]
MKRESQAMPHHVPELLRRAAWRHPDRPGLRCADRTLSYRELDGAVDALTSRLTAAGVEPGSRVGLCVERGPLAFLGAAALMRLGCAYVPLDPQHPRARLLYCVDDSGALVVLADDVGGSALVECDVDTVSIVPDDLTPRPGARWEGPDPAPDAGAYVIYTSGTTGTPKGVEVTHANVLALLRDGLGAFGFAEHEVWPMQHAHTFDVSVWEMWAAVATGATLVVVEGEVPRNPELLAELLVREQVTRLHIVPSAFRHLAEAVEEEGIKVPLRHVTFAGEAVNYAAVESWTRSQPEYPTVWSNAYGITETTVYNTFRRLTERDLALAAAATPIGPAFAGSPAVVLDEELRPVPPGVTGEILVGGDQVAKGYTGAEEMTNERFLRLPGRTGRWYRTGDLAFADATGGLHYIGRKDEQTKIRGFRIELGEIDHAMRALAWVRDAAAVVQRTARDEPVLTAFVVPDHDAAPEVRARLRGDLAARLPEHMIPVRVVTLEQLPRNSSGKTDRRALAAHSRNSPLT